MLLRRSPSVCGNHLLVSPAQSFIPSAKIKCHGGHISVTDAKLTGRAKMKHKGNPNHQPRGRWVYVNGYQRRPPKQSLSLKGNPNYRPRRGLIEVSGYRKWIKEQPLKRKSRNDLVQELEPQTPSRNRAIVTAKLRVDSLNFNGKLSLDLDELPQNLAQKIGSSFRMNGKKVVPFSAIGNLGNFRKLAVKALTAGGRLAKIIARLAQLNSVLKVIYGVGLKLFGWLVPASFIHAAAAGALLLVAL